MNNTNQPNIDNNNIDNNIHMINYPYVHKSVLLSYFFLIFFGWFGLHRIYVGKKISGIGILIINLFMWFNIFCWGIFSYSRFSYFLIFIFLLCFLSLVLWLLFDFFTFFSTVEKINEQKQKISLQKLKNIIEKKLANSSYL